MLQYILEKIWKFIICIWNFLMYHMFYVIVFSLLILIISFGVHNKRKKYPDLIYTNIDLRIVAINSDCSLSDDKFHKPQLCNTVLFETIKEPHLYCEINTCDLPLSNGRPTIHINTAWLYNHQKGDIVHFDYLHKDRFFEIKKR